MPEEVRPNSGLVNAHNRSSSAAGHMVRKRGRGGVELVLKVGKAVASATPE